jgi:hypothetical protein
MFQMERKRLQTGMEKPADMVDHVLRTQFLVQVFHGPATETVNIRFQNSEFDR